MKKILFIFTILFSSICLSACDDSLVESIPNSQNQFLGKWGTYYVLEADDISIDDDYSAEFADDGTCKISDGDYTFDATYQVRDKNHADIIVKNDDSDTPITWSASIENDVLTMGFDELLIYLIPE